MCTRRALTGAAMVAALGTGLAVAPASADDGNPSPSGTEPEWVLRCYGGSIVGNYLLQCRY